MSAGRCQGPFTKSAPLWFLSSAPVSIQDFFWCGQGGIKNRNISLNNGVGVSSFKLIFWAFLKKGLPSKTLITPIPDDKNTFFTLFFLFFSPFFIPFLQLLLVNSPLKRECRTGGHSREIQKPALPHFPQNLGGLHCGAKTQFITESVVVKPFALFISSSPGSFLRYSQILIKSS